MKKIMLVCVVAAMAAMMVACGNKNAKKAATETVATEVVATEAACACENCTCDPCECTGECTAEGACTCENCTCNPCECAAAPAEAEANTAA